MLSSTGNLHREDGLGTRLFAYQAVYALKRGPHKGCISHRCANRKNKKSTLCLTLSHMLDEDQATNRKRSVCHEAIRIKANKAAQDSNTPSLRGVETFDGCPHKGPNQDEGCFISYGPNKNVTAKDSVYRYVLPIPDLESME